MTLIARQELNDASHNGLRATLEQQTDAGSWVPISFAS